MWEVVKLIPTKEEWYAALKARQGDSLQRKLSAATAAVCGLGGLGSNIAIALARVGIGRLILIDHDRVDITNLHRQQYKAHQIGKYKAEALAENLSEIAPYVRVDAFAQKITAENFSQLLRGADVICEAFDDAEAKAMLVNGVLEELPRCFLVAASGMAGMGTPNAIHTRKITERFYLCGDEISDAADPIGLVAPRVMLCAAHQAHTALRLIAGEFEV